MTVSNSILEAVKIGLWDFLPQTIDSDELEASDEVPGAREKLDVLADHLRRDAGFWKLDERYHGDPADRESPSERLFRRKPR